MPGVFSTMPAMALTTPFAMHQALTDFETYLSQERRRQPRTTATYMGVLKEFAEFLPREASGETVAIEQVDKALLVRFLTAQARAAGETSSATWNIRLAALRAFYDYLFKQEVIAVNPALRVDRQSVHANQPVPLSLDEMLGLIEAFERHSPSALKSRNVALAQVFMHCGLRVQEVVSLRLDQVDLVGGFLLDVRTKGGKKLSSPMNDVVTQAISTYLRDRRTLVFPEEPAELFVCRNGMPLSVRLVQQLVKGYAKRAGITRRVTPHLLRHSSASELVELGINLRVVQEHLGHASVKTTERYTRVSDPARRSAVDAFGAAWRRRERERQRPTGT